ncbi:MAG: acyl carrier protein [Acholeplasmatales bacterium]|nr:acyl carrier protein [Acholeplasmatales bacterium]
MFEEIKKLFVECANVDEEEVKPEARLKQDLGIDSIYAVELTLQLEEIYGVVIDYEELEALETVDDIVKLVEKKVGK